MEAGPTMRFIAQQIEGQTAVAKAQLAGALQAASGFCTLFSPHLAPFGKPQQQERWMRVAEGSLLRLCCFHAPHSDISFTLFHARPGHGIN